jgi:hypothetical protein
MTTTSPILLIAAGDVADEAAAARDIAAGSPDRVELWVVPDADHTQAPSTHQAEWGSIVNRLVRRE